VMCARVVMCANVVMCGWMASMVQDLESLFWGLVLAIAACGPAAIYYKSLGARASMLLAIIAFTLIFVVARIAHTATYLLAMSGARSLSWLVGVLSVLGVALVVSPVGSPTLIKAALSLVVISFHHG
jgi:hypothetical protein